MKESIVIRIDVYKKRRLEEDAEREGRTLSGLVRHIIEKYLRGSDHFD